MTEGVFDINSKKRTDEFDIDQFIRDVAEILSNN